MTIKHSHADNGKYVIYRYKFLNNVVYVGKTNRPLEQRIKEHCKELKFYGLTDVEYYETTMKDDIFKHEAFWINHFKPILNEFIPNANKGLKKMPRNQWKKYEGEIKYITPIYESLSSLVK